MGRVGRWGVGWRACPSWRTARAPVGPPLSALRLFEGPPLSALRLFDGPFYLDISQPAAAMPPRLHEVGPAVLLLPLSACTECGVQAHCDVQGAEWRLQGEARGAVGRRTCARADHLALPVGQAEVDLPRAALGARLRRLVAQHGDELGEIVLHVALVEQPLDQVVVPGRER